MTKYPENEWEECPFCDDCGAIPVHICHGDDERCRRLCPDIEPCEFCWSNEKSVYNQKRLLEEQEKI
jgi:hypothetical protein